MGNGFRLYLIFMLAVSLWGERALSLEKDLVIDNGGEGFARIQSLIADDLGNIYLLDSKSHTVYVYNRQGEEIRRFGKKGEGPGDFIRPYQIALDQNGNILVTEVINRATIFSAAGEIRQTLKLGVNNAGFFSGIVYAGPGLFFGLHSAADESREQRIISEKGTPLEVRLFSEPSGRVGEGEMSFFYTHSSYSLYHFFVHQSGISAAAISTRYEIRLLDDKGQILRVVQRNATPSPFSAAERDLLEKKIDKIDTWPESIRERFKKRIPKRRNFISGLRVSPGLLWVFRTENDLTREQDPVLADLFNLNGEYLGCVSLPRMPLWISERHLYIVGSDDEDAVLLERFRYSLN